MSQVLSGSFKALASRLRLGRARNAALEHARRAIGRSDLFDAEWYLQRNADVARAGLDPLEHFILHGGSEGRSPGPRFDAKWYLRKYADVARSGVNPLVHYLDHGRGEGRSIKALVPGSAHEADADQARGKKRSPSRDVAPYVSDYDTVWRASPFDWLTLGVPHEPEQQGKVELPADPERLLVALAEGETRARIALFLGLKHGAQTAAELPDMEKTGLGLGEITDGWFAHARQLLLRTSGTVTGACQVLGFQRSNEGDIYPVATQSIVGTSELVRLDLENPLGPVLLIWQGNDGIALQAALILFPSLYRGGMHHAEALAVASLKGESATIPAYMSELARELSGTGPLQLAQITVQPRGANGSGLIFQSAVEVGLARHFGVATVAQADSEEAYLPSDRLLCTMPSGLIAERRRSGSELLLPPDCLPSLAALCSLAGSTRLGASALAIVPQLHPEHAVLVCLPQSTDAAVDFSHPALPAAAHIWRPASAGPSALVSHAGLPSVIRMLDATVWQVDPLLPLSPDVEIPPVACAGAEPLSLRIVLSHSGSEQDLALSIAAISAQTGAQVTEILLLAEQGHQPSLLGSGVPVRAISPDELARAGSESGEPADLVILSDTSVFAHDRRTFAILGSLCQAAGVGAATCAVTASLPDDEAESRATVSWVADCTVAPALPGDDMITALCPGASFDVAAGDPRMLAVRREVWDAVLAEVATGEAPAELAIAVARACRQKDLATVATTLVRVATGKTDLALPAQATLIPEIFADAAIRDTATHLVRLLP